MYLYLYLFVLFIVVHPHETKDFFFTCYSAVNSKSHPIPSLPSSSVSSFHPAMATVWLRHPRYSFLILFTLLTTFYLLFIPHHGPIQSFHVQDDSLKTRVERAHTIYDKFLVQRAGLLKKWGPEPKDISVYVFLLSFFCYEDRFLDTWMCKVSLLTRHLGLLTPCVSFCIISLLILFFFFFPADTYVVYQGISLLRHSTAHMKLNVTAL